MTESIAVTDTRVSDALPADDIEAQEIIIGWLKAKGFEQVEEQVQALAEQHYWVLRMRDNGYVQAVDPQTYATSYATAEEREFSKLADMLVGNVVQVVDWQYLAYVTEDDEEVWLDAKDITDARARAKNQKTDRIRRRVTLVPDWTEELVS